jgi:hypothetical protein
MKTLNSILTIIALFLAIVPANCQTYQKDFPSLKEPLMANTFSFVHLMGKGIWCIGSLHKSLNS